MTMRVWALLPCALRAPVGTSASIDGDVTPYRHPREGDAKARTQPGCPLPRERRQGRGPCFRSFDYSVSGPDRGADPKARRRPVRRFQSSWPIGIVRAGVRARAKSPDHAASHQARRRCTRHRPPARTAGGARGTQPAVAPSHPQLSPPPPGGDRRRLDVLGDQRQHAGAAADRRHRRGPPRRRHRVHRPVAGSEAGAAHRQTHQAIPGMALPAPRRGAARPGPRPPRQGRGCLAAGSCGANCRCFACCDAFANARCSRRSSARSARRSRHRPENTPSPRRQRPHRRRPSRTAAAARAPPVPRSDVSFGSFPSSTAASRCAMCSRPSCSIGSASRNPGSPDCFVPSMSPPPRSRKSSSAIRNPSSVSRSSVSRRRAASFTHSSCSSRQKLASAPRPTRPRNWCNCASPKRSACSITITVAAGTSTPTSTTVVATSSRHPPAANSASVASRTAASCRPCASPTAVAEPLAQHGEPLLGRGQVEHLALRHQRADPVDLRALVQLARHRIEQIRQRPQRVQRRAHRLPPGRLLGQAADIHLAPLRQQQRARDRRRGHHQHVGQLALAAQQQPLIDAEPVLLVDHRQRQVVVFDAVLEQRVRADDQRHRAVLQTAQQLRPGARPSRRRSAARPAPATGATACGDAASPAPRSAPSCAACLPASTARSMASSATTRLARADIALQQPQHAPIR